MPETETSLRFELALNRGLLGAYSVSMPALFPRNSQDKGENTVRKGIGMCSLGDYFSERFIIWKENAPEDVLFDSDVEREIGAERTALLLGVTILDAIFDPLYQYQNIAINTETEKNYSADTPFEHLLKYAKILDIEIPNNSIHQHKEKWNPSNNEKDFADIVRPNIDIYGNKARSQLKRQIKLQKYIHVFLKDISTILDLIAKNGTEEKHIQIKYLFLFYILNQDFKIIRNHLPDSWLIDYDRMSFVSMYLRFLANDFNRAEVISEFLIRAKLSGMPTTPFVQKKMIINYFVDKNYDNGIKIVADYIEKNVNISFDSALWESIARVGHVSNLLDGKIVMEMIDYIASIFRDELISEKGRIFPGNIDYIEDLYTAFWPSDPTALFSNRPLDFFVRGRKDYDEILNAPEKKRKNFWEEIETLTNPFSNFTFSSSCRKCPFRIYQFPIKQLLRELKTIIKDLRLQKNELEKWLENYSGEDWYEDAKGKVNEVEDLVNSLEHIEYRDCHEIAKLHKDRKSKKNSGKEDNKNVVPVDVEIKIDEVMETVLNTLNFISPFWEIICFEKEEVTEENEVTIDDLSVAIIGKMIENLIVDDYNGQLNPGSMESNAIFPYLSKQSIQKWKKYFKYFCTKDRLIALPLIHVSPNEQASEKCYSKFLHILKERFIMSMVKELKTLEDVNESSIH